MSSADKKAARTSKDATPRKKSPVVLPWKQADQPSFCDASASVAASTFAARRLPEMKDMWLAACGESDGNKNDSRTIVIDATTTSIRTTALTPDISIRALQSGGCKTSNRHLRRRATSYKSRNKRYRFPTRKQQNQQQPAAAGDSIEAKAQRQLSRRARRSKRPLLRANHEQSWQTETAFSLTTPKKDDSDSLLLPPPVRWMSTHLWHAKRFHMETLFSWQIPMMHTNRGSQAALRLAHEKCVIQDATWCSQPIWFSVPQTASLSSIATVLRSMIPTFSVPDNNIPSDKECVLFGEGIVYRPNLFPRAACGPVTWIFTNQSWNRHAPPLSQEDDRWYVYLMAYPSMLSIILSDINKLFSSSALKHTIVGPKLFVNGGLACVRLRGSSSMTCLKQGLQSLDLELSALSAMEEYFNAPRPQFSLLTVQYQSPSNHPKDNRRWDPLYVCRQAPRDEHFSQNVGVTGYDIYCPTYHANYIFQSLVLKGGACPIGWMEQAHLCLEAEPPIPVYPRDYPDTLDGRLYWNTINAGMEHEADSACNYQWKIVRRFFEGGTGRVPRTVQMKAVDWFHLLMDDDTLKDTILEAPSWPNLALVRGLSFGEPFQQVLQAAAPPIHRSTHTTATSLSASRRKRKHRSERAPNTFVQSPFLGKEQLSIFQESCKNMLQNLSLPALLLVHVDITGKGRLQAGDLLHSMNKDSSIVLGAVTAGCFSPSRGQCHGMAVVGGALFLKAVAAVDQDFPLFIVIGCNKGKELRLGVLISRSKGGNKSEFIGAISIIL